MQKKLKQTGLMTFLIIFISLGLIFVLQKLTDTGNDSPNNPPKVSLPEKGPNDTNLSGTVVIDQSKLTPEEKCKLIENADGQINCYDNIILKEVLASNTLLACDDLKYAPNIQYCQDMFYKNKALLDVEITICEKIKDTYIKTQCTDSLKLKESVQNLSIEECNSITDVNQKNSCIDKVVLKSAITNGDVSQCNLLEDGTLKDLCIDKTTKQADTKNYKQALEKMDTTLCNSLSENVKNECQDAVNYNLGVSKNDISVCAKILETEQKNECMNNVYLALAKEKNDPTLCQKSTDQVAQANCAQIVNVELLKSALTSKDATKCALITDSVLKQKCTDAF